jgi:hypothetical protein
MTDTSPESPPAPPAGRPPATRAGPAPETGEQVMTPETATAPPPPRGRLCRPSAVHVPEKGGPDAR